MQVLFLVNYIRQFVGAFSDKNLEIKNLALISTFFTLPEFQYLFQHLSIHDDSLEIFQYD